MIQYVCEATSDSDLKQYWKDFDERWDKFYNIIYFKVEKLANTKNYDVQYNINFAEDKDHLIKLVKSAYHDSITENQNFVIMGHFMYNRSIQNIAVEMKVTTTQIYTHIRNGINRILEDLVQSILSEKEEINAKELSCRTFNVLRKHDYISNNDLANISKDEFLSYKNAGIKSWNGLVKYMNNHGISYKE